MQEREYLMGVKETNIGNQICVALSKLGCKIFRSQSGQFFTKYGSEITIGVKGMSDYHGHRPDGKAFYIETKTKTGKASDEQKRFLRAMHESGALAGIARSVDEAVEIIEGRNNTDEFYDD